MLENETQAIIKTLSERTIGNARSITLKDILVADLPKNIKLYLQCEVTRLLRDDLINSPHFSNIRFGEPTTRHLTRMYTRSIAGEYSFARDEIVTMLGNGVHFVENYICRPQWMLEQFIFEKSERATIPDLQTKFEYFSEYLYYAKLVFGFLEQRNRQEISRTEFRSLLNRIDDEIVKQHNARELAYLARSIFELILMSPEISGKSIPISPVLIFLEDKKMTAVRDYLEKICHIRNTRHLTIEQLSTIIEDLYGEEKLQSAPDSRSDLPSQTPQQVDESATQPTVAEGTQLAGMETTGHAPPVPDRRNIALSLTFSGMSDGFKSVEPIPTFRDLRTMIDDSLQKRFVNAVFQNDEAYYNAVIDALNGMTSWKNASLYLQTFYETSKLDPFLPDVVQFTDLIQLRYSFREP